jgi:hypothetical protein
VRLVCEPHRPPIEHCCDYGRGFYRIKTNGESPVVSGGAFRSRIAETFVVGEPVVVDPVINYVDYVVAIKYDRDSNGDFVIGLGTNSVTERYADYVFPIDTAYVLLLDLLAVGPPHRIELQDPVIFDGTISFWPLGKH